MTTAELLKMPVGQKIGGGFVLTIKKTKKFVQLPNKSYIFTVVLFDATGEILADFKTIGGSPLGKGRQVKVIVAEIQAADSTGRSKVDQTGKKLYVDQFSMVTQTITEYEDELNEQEQRWDAITQGKIRHGLTCSLVKGKRSIDISVSEKEEINSLVEFIKTGEVE